MYTFIVDCLFLQYSIAMPKYCFNCSNKAIVACSCCKEIVYCSDICQKVDFHAIHKYEASYYQSTILKNDLSISSLNAGNDIDTENPSEYRDIEKTNKAPQIKKNESGKGNQSRSYINIDEMKRINALTDKIKNEQIVDIKEYNRITELTNLTLATQEKSNVNERKKLKMSQKGQDMIKDMVNGLLSERGNESKTKEKMRNDYDTMLKSLYQTVKDIPTLQNKKRDIKIGAFEDMRRGYFFRKLNLLYAKRKLAVVTGEPKYAEEAVNYEKQINNENNRYIHEWLFSELNYDEMSTRYDKQQLESTIDNYVNTKWEKMLEQLADNAVFNMNIIDEEKKKKKARKEEKRSKTDNFSCIVPTEEEIEKSNNTNKDKNKKEAVGFIKSIDTIEEDYFWKKSVASLDDLCNGFILDYNSKKQSLYDDDKIAKEECDNSIFFVKKTYTDLRSKFLDLFTALEKDTKSATSKETTFTFSGLPGTDKKEDDPLSNKERSAMDSLNHFYEWIKKKTVDVLNVKTLLKALKVLFLTSCVYVVLTIISLCIGWTSSTIIGQESLNSALTDSDKLSQQQLGIGLQLGNIDNTINSQVDVMGSKILGVETRKNLTEYITHNIFTPSMMYDKHIVSSIQAGVSGVVENIRLKYENAIKIADDYAKEFNGVRFGDKQVEIYKEMLDYANTFTLSIDPVVKHDAIKKFVVYYKQQNSVTGLEDPAMRELELLTNFKETLTNLGVDFKKILVPLEGMNSTLKGLKTNLNNVDNAIRNSGNNAPIFTSLIHTFTPSFLDPVIFSDYLDGFMTTTTHAVTGAKLISSLAFIAGIEANMYKLYQQVSVLGFSRASLVSILWGDYTVFSTVGLILNSVEYIASSAKSFYDGVDYISAGNLSKLVHDIGEKLSPLVEGAVNLIGTRVMGKNMDRKDDTYLNDIIDKFEQLTTEEDKVNIIDEYKNNGSISHFDYYRIIELIYSKSANLSEINPFKATLRGTVGIPYSVLNKHMYGTLPGILEGIRVVSWALPLSSFLIKTISVMTYIVYVCSYWKVGLVVGALVLWKGYNLNKEESKKKPHQQRDITTICKDQMLTLFMTCFTWRRPIVFSTAFVIHPILMYFTSTGFNAFEENNSLYNGFEWMKTNIKSCIGINSTSLDYTQFHPDVEKKIMEENIKRLAEIQANTTALSVDINASDLTRFQLIANDLSNIVDGDTADMKKIIALAASG